jgi:RHS repeat-associated protein
LQFTGHERDFGSDGARTLDYMHARYYSSSMGRFLSVDPVLGDASAPQSWNRYSYVRNNPINRTDPDGRFDWDFQKMMKNVASAVGIHWMNDTAARSAYNAAKAQLVQGSPGAAAARTAAKVAAREMTSPAGAKLAETMRPIADEASRVGGSVAKGSAAVDAAFVSTAARTAGPVLAAASVTVSVVRIANAPDGQGYRTMAGESGALLGAVSFGQGGAWAGAAAGGAIGAVFGGVGAVPGAIVGGLIGLVGGGVGGGYLGEQAAHNVYDATVPQQ